jgi:hypothetical protein
MNAYIGGIIMRKSLPLVTIILAMLFLFVACEKKEEQAEPKSTMPPGPIVDTQETSQGHGVISPKTEFKIVLPPEVKEQWSAVKFIIEDKKENKKQEFTVHIGGELKIPDSKLTVKVGPFLPDFKMSAQTITSASNNPNNPTVGVSIYEDGKKVFPPSGTWGWLYKNFPTIHSFQHERYGLVLKEGIKK